MIDSYDQRKSFGASSINGHARPAKTYQRDRVCAHPDCNTHLSIYNELEFCYRHQVPSVPRTRGTRIA